MSLPLQPRGLGRSVIARYNASVIDFRSRFWSADPSNRPAWWDWARTILLSASMAVVIAHGARIAVIRSPAELLDQAALNALLGPLMAIAVCIGLVTQLLHSLATPLLGGRERLAQRSPRWQSWYFSSMSLLGVLLGWPIGATLASGELPHWGQGGSIQDNLGVLLLASVVFGSMVDLVYGARLRQAQTDKRATESQLRLLQGQIEPHFLFNTLATVHSLIDHEPAKAQRMLESFTDYLRSTTTQLRGDDGTLGGELDLVDAYLRLLQIRMDERLRFRIEADEALRPIALPPLLLQPLVENAIRHGLEPTVEGGEVLVRASLRDGRLQLSVQDSGQGMEAAARRPTPTTAPTTQGTLRGAGVALVNLRHRLAARYGQDATLTLTDTRPGTLASLSLPCPLPTRQTTR